MFLRDAKRTCIDCIIGNCEERSEATMTPTQNLNGNPSILGELTYGIGRRKTAARSKITKLVFNLFINGVCHSELCMLV